MKIGIRIPCYRRWCRRDEVKRIALAAERLGFDSLWVQDHVVAPCDEEDDLSVLGTSGFMEARGAAPPPAKATVAEYYAGDDWWLDPYIVWGFVASITERVTLASDILVLPYRNPIHQAKMIGTLDVLSDGRMMICTGIGHVAAESKALGLDFAARGRMHDEHLAVIRTLLGAREAEFEGEFTRFGRVRSLIEPVQKPCPPIYIGGNGPRAIRRAVEIGDGWAPNAPDAEGLVKGMGLLRQAAKDHGRAEAPPVVVSLPSRIRLATPSLQSSRRPAMSADEAVAVLRGYRDVGVAHVALGLAMPTADIYLEQIEAFAREVLPHVR